MTDQTSDNAEAINEAINILYDVRDFLRTQRVISRTGSDPVHARDFAEGDLLQRTLSDLLSGLVLSVRGIDRLFRQLVDLVECPWTSAEERGHL